MRAQAQRSILFVMVASMAIILITMLDTQREMVDHLDSVELRLDVLLETGLPLDRTLVEKILPYCHEDEAWSPVHHDTPGALVDSRGVTRMCVHLDNLYVDGTP